MLGFLTKDKKLEKEADGHAAEKYEDLLDDGLEHPPVIKVVEVVATSVTSFDDAIASGLKTAARSLRHITGADVRHMTVAVRNGRVSQYRVDLKVAFALDDDEGHDDDD